MFWTTLQQFGSQGISFIVSVILARLLEPKDFGIISLFGILTGIAVLLMSSGMTTSLIRTKNIDNEDLSTVFVFNLAVSLALYFIIFFIAPWVEQFYQVEDLAKIIRVYSLIFVIQGLTAVQKTLITKSLEFKKLFIIHLPSLIVSSICGVVLAYMGFGVWALVYMGIIQYALDSLQMWIKSNYTPSLKFNKQKFRHHFRFGINMTITSILNVLFQNIYIIYIGKILSPATLGLYSRAESLKDLPVKNVMNILKRVLVPFFSTVDDDKLLKAYYKKILTTVLFILSPILVILIFRAEEIVLLLLTAKWIGVVPYLQILCFGAFLLPLSEYNTNILVVKGQSRLVLKLEIYKKITTVIIFLVSIYWGIYGILYGQVLNSIIVFLINSYYTKQFLDYSKKEQIWDVAPYILVSFAAGVLSYLILDQFSRFNISLHLAINIFIYVVLMGLFYLLLVKALKLEAINTLSSIYKRKRK